jgi:hypothetical protein
VPQLELSRTLSDAIGKDLPDKQRIIDEMLAGYSDARDTLWAREKNGRGGDSALPVSFDKKNQPVLTIYWTPAHAELDKLLHKMARHANPGYWHLAEFYFRCDRTLKPVKKRTKKGHLCPDGRQCALCWVGWSAKKDVGNYRLEYERHSGLKVERVHLAIVYLGRAWPKDKAQPLDSFKLAA